MGEKKRRAAQAERSVSQPPAQDPGRTELPTAVADLKRTIVLWHHVVAAGDLLKARDLHAVIMHWSVRVAACNPRNPGEVQIKAAFLGRDLPALRFTLAQPAQALVDAALAHDAAQFGPAEARPA